VPACRYTGLQSSNVLILRFLYGLNFALSQAMFPFGAVVVSYSDPVRDKSFQSKMIVTGIMLGLGVAYAGIVMADTWRYFRLWDFPGQQIVLQVCSRKFWTDMNEKKNIVRIDRSFVD
jgi:hypothetical protein